ncbi:hypothetical protein KSF73_06775 [Burkholderiaceae bacterium DAT-1]|nr:hypothetical protein [Burkholderiaceae bacterium DAT-1]
MRTTRLNLAILIMTVSLSSAWAASVMSAEAVKYENSCKQAGGYFQYGTVNAPPNSDYRDVVNFKRGKPLKGIPLSHTHIEITSGLDGQVYDVAIDNVFASDYNPRRRDIPASYRQAITAGSTLYFCGGNPGKEPYSTKGEHHAKQGFDWVHTNCESPGSKFADGWIYTDTGVNLTNSHTYCYLWK